MPTTITTPTLPTDEELRAAWSALADVEEDHFEPLARRVFAVTNAQQEARATLEEIGALYAFINETRDLLLSRIEGHLKKIERSMRHDLTVIARDGHMGNVPRYDEHGLEL